MIKVKFYGSLKEYGTEFSLDVRDTAEAIRALCSQIKGLRQKLQQGYYKVRIGKDYINPEALEEGLFYRLKEGQTVHFTPVIKGSKSGGIIQTIVGAVMVAVGYVFAWTGVGAVVGNMGLALMLGGVSQMLTRNPNTNIGTTEEKEKKTSTSFSNLSNLVAQGNAVPLAYGLIRTGSLIISQGVETVTIKG